MSLLNTEKIIITNYLLQKNTLQYTIIKDSEVENFKIEIPACFDKEIFFHFYKIVVCSQALSFTLIAKKVIVDIPLTPFIIDFIERIKNPFLSGSSVLAGKVLLAYPSIGELILNKNYEDFLIDFEKEIDRNKVVLPYSMGKESLLSRLLLTEAGFEVSPLFIDTGITEGKNPGKAIDVPFDFISLNEADTDWVSSVISEGVWDLPVNGITILIVSLCYAISKDIGYVSMGCEYETTSLEFKGIYGSVSYGHTYSQSNFIFKEIERLIYNYNFPVKFFSPVQNFSTILEEAYLYTFYPGNAERQHSCDYYYIANDKLIPCRTCIKCDILNAILVGLNIYRKINKLKPFVTSHIIDEYVKEIKQNPAQHIEPFLSKEDQDEIENLLKGYLSNAELRFDYLHSEEFLPGKYYHFLIKKHEEFKKLWDLKK